jgi:hypothetical protein
MGPSSITVPQRLKGFLGITVHPQEVAGAVLSSIDIVVAVGEQPDRTIGEFCRVAGLKSPNIPRVDLHSLEVMIWMVRSGAEPKVISATPGETERIRHLRKYSVGELGEDKSFFFRGPAGKLNLRSQPDDVSPDRRRRRR